MIMRFTDQHTSTPEKVVGLMENSPWLVNENVVVSEKERQKRLDEIVAQVNLLDFEQRRRLREDGDAASNRFFNSLSAAEKSQFLQKTVEHHFKSVMKAFNQMPQEERRRLVEQARRDMQKNNVDGQNMDRLREEDEKVFETLVDKGLGAYYEDASVETKMDLAPLMEEMQQRLRGFQNH